MHDVDRTVSELNPANEYEDETEGETEGFLGETEEEDESEQFLGSILGSVLGGEMETEAFYAGEQEGFLDEAETEGEGETEGEEESEDEDEMEGEDEYRRRRRPTARRRRRAAGGGAYGTVAYGGACAPGAYGVPVLDEDTEMELASELLTVRNEEEMEYFLGNLIKAAGKGLSNFAKSSAGQALGGALKSVAKVALPAIGQLGNLVVPGIGGAIGGQLADMAGNALGLELEGLSPQDQEFEAARQFVRLGAASAQHAARTPVSVPPHRAAARAVAKASKTYAPGLLQPAPRRTHTGGVASNGTHRAAQHSARPAPRHVSGRPVTYGSAPAAASGARRVHARTWGGAPATTTTGGTIARRPGGRRREHSATGYPIGDATTIVTNGSGVPAYNVTRPQGGTGPIAGYGIGSPHYTRSGRWYRRGRKIVLVGV